MTDALPRHLRAALAAEPAAPLLVAFSGGPDSTALLHALAHEPQARARGLRAAHVDHGLQADSAGWAARCARFCVDLDVPCALLRVEVPRNAGRGLEAAARQARHEALAGLLHEGEWLLFGHHRDDQVETVLLKLLRGAGPEGLGGMRARRPFGAGQLWRPLLELPRTTLLDYVAAHRLDCIEDPSNADTRLARNRLRHDILPALLNGWPQARASILHSAALSREAADALRSQWLPAFDALHDRASGSLDLPGWRALLPALREPLLDHWLHGRGLAAPGAAQRRQIERQCDARPGQSPCVRWAGTELHIWKQRLWALPVQAPIDPDWQQQWIGGPLVLPDGGELALTVASTRLPEALQVRMRRGGERIRPVGNPHTRELRDLFQQAQMPPWRRAACPLLHVDGELIAVADCWISARGAELFDRAGARPRWRPGR